MDGKIGPTYIWVLFHPKRMVKLMGTKTEIKMDDLGGKTENPIILGNIHILPLRDPLSPWPENDVMEPFKCEPGS